jgi:hypothetical protein
MIAAAGIDMSGATDAAIEGAAGLRRGSVATGAVHKAVASLGVFEQRQSPQKARNKHKNKGKLASSSSAPGGTSNSSSEIKKTPKSNHKSKMKRKLSV